MKLICARASKRFSAARCFEQEPRPALGLVDPDFDQAGGSDVAMLGIPWLVLTFRLLLIWGALVRLTVGLGCSVERVGSVLAQFVS
jgi:hypothetical protein